MNRTSLRQTGWSSWLQKSIDYFQGNSKVGIENNARWEALLLGSASASWMEAAFHSRMQMQEWPGFLLDYHIWRVPLDFKNHWMKAFCSSSCRNVSGGHWDGQSGHPYLLKTHTMIAPELKATVSVVVAAPMSGLSIVVASTQVWKDTFGFGLTLSPVHQTKEPTS